MCLVRREQDCAADSEGSAERQRTAQPLTEKCGGEERDEDALERDEHRRVRRARPLEPEVEERVCETRLEQAEQEVTATEARAGGTTEAGQAPKGDRRHAELDHEQVGGRETSERVLRRRGRDARAEGGEHKGGIRRVRRRGRHRVGRVLAQRRVGVYSMIRPRSRKPTAPYIRSAVGVDCRLAVRQPRASASWTSVAVSAVPKPRRRECASVPTS